MKQNLMNSFFQTAGVTIMAAMLPWMPAISGEVIPPLPQPPAPINAANAVTGEKKIPKVVDADLMRRETAPAVKLPWSGKPAVAKVKEKAAVPEGQIDMSDGDVYMKTLGPLTREERTDTTPNGPVSKQVLTMTKDVEIEMPQSKSVLRAQRVVIVQDMKSGDTELIDAKGKVELSTPERKGKGETMRIETQKGPNGDYVKNQFVLTGDMAASKKATLWVGKDVVQALRFFRDERADSFLATGYPVAVISMGEDTAATSQAPKPVQPAKSSSGGVGSLSLDGPGKVSLQSDGRLAFDGPTGKLELSPNVVIIKEGATAAEGARICSDSSIITMDTTPAETPKAGATPTPPAGGGMMAGTMKFLESFGRVELKSGSSTVQCDKMKLDMATKLAVFEMNNPADTVSIFDADAGMVMMAPKALRMNMETREFKADGPMKSRPFVGAVPSNRAPPKSKEELEKEKAAEAAKAKDTKEQKGLFGGLGGKKK